MAHNTSTVTLSFFEQNLKKVLKIFTDPQRIGETSPLASPYFLSRALATATDPALPLTRGGVLCQLIRQAAATLWGGELPQGVAAMKAALAETRQKPGTARYAYLVLELRCFQDYFKPRRTSDIWESDAYLPGSQSEHYRDFDIAITQLAKVLLDHLHPTLRPELPAPLPFLFGYQSQIAQAVGALRNNQTVSLNGPGGVGKSTVGAAIVQHFADRPRFWFTIRPTLNDRLSSLLFALGHFLYSLGASQLWQLMVATGGVLADYNVALALVRQDLAHLQGNLPLLCFDEIDQLDVSKGEGLSHEYTQMLAFLDSLRGATPLLLIGQKPLLEATLYQTLNGFGLAEMNALFQQAHHPLTPIAAEQLYRVTHGNPRLLLMALALQASGDPLDDLVTTLAQSPGLSPLLRRLWPRLTPGERRLLQRLAVFPMPAPASSWPDEQTELQALRQRRLVIADQDGGLELLPALRWQIEEDLPQNVREQCHLEAAQIRLAHGEFTAAAYHYAHAQRTSEAVRVWFPYRRHELQRGQTTAAATIFTSMSHHHLGKNESKALALIQAELAQLRGAMAEGLTTLAAQDWGGDSEIRVRAHALRGEFLEALGHPDQALALYEDGVTVTTRLVSQLVNLRYKRSRLQIRQKAMDQAWREARLAECQLYILRGILEDESGRYADARLAFQQALTLAETLEDGPSLAEAERNLANVYGRLQDAAKAEQHARRAIDHFQRIGDHVGVAHVQDNLVFIYLQTGEYAKAITAATKALPFFQARNMPYQTAVITINLAEAYFEVGELEKAQTYAEAVLAMEERHPYPYALFTLGRIKAQQAAFALAEIYFQQALQAGQANAEPYVVAYAQRELGLLYRQQGQMTAAQAQLNLAYTFFEQAGMTKEGAQTLALLQKTKASA